MSIPSGKEGDVEKELWNKLHDAGLLSGFLDTWDDMDENFGDRDVFREKFCEIVNSLTAIEIGSK